LLNVKKVVNFLSTKEVKIFLTFFIIYSLFIHWIGWNEDSRFDLVRSIIDEKRFDIDSFFNNTGDRSFYNDHYYSDKNPGTSFLAVPTYEVWKYVYNNFFPRDFKKLNSGTSQYMAINSTTVHELTFFWPVNPGFFIYFSMIFITIFTSSLFGALTVVLIYKFSNYFIKEENKKIALAMIAGFGTLLFPMSLIFMEGIIAAFFAFASFYLLFKAKIEKQKSSKLFLLSGLLIGFGMSSSEIVLIVAITNLVYVFLTRKDRVIFYAIGAIIGLLPLLAYNYAIFHSPFLLTRWYLDQSIWGNLGIEGLNLPNPYAILKLLFYPEIGLFVYYPVLLFSFVGLFYLYKKFKLESLLIFIIFIANVIVISSLFGWWGGIALGPRHLTMSIPFIILPLIELLTRFDKKIFLKIALFSLLFYSILVNFLLLQDSTSVNLEKRGDSLNFDQLNSFKVIQNSIYDYYFPFFLKEGSRSKIIEGIITDWTKTDIRDFKSQQTNGIKFITTPFGFLTFRLQTLSIAIVILIFFVIWRKEIIKVIPKKYLKFLYLVPFVIVILALDLQTINFGENWYPIYKNATYTDPYRWASNNGTIYLFSSEKTNAILNFSFVGYKNQTFDIILNNKKIGLYSTNLYSKTAEMIQLNSGINILELYSHEGCHMPTEWNDTKCLSIGISNMTVLTENNLKNNEFIWGKNWFNEENISGIKLRWMSNNASLFIASNENKEYNLNFLVQSYYKPRTLLISLGNSSKELNIGLNGTEIKLKTKLVSGINEIYLISKENCDIPKIISNSNDNRCLSFALGNFTVS